jgi:transposase
VGVVESVVDDEPIIERVAGLDVGKEEVVCCVRVPDRADRGRRGQEVRTYTTMTRSLIRLGDWLRELGVTRVVMESTSDYWKPVFYVLEAAGLDPWLVNAKDVKHLPGRPKTDTLDAVWLAKLAERQMLRPSLVPPPPLRRLRDLTRYRSDLVVMRTAQKQRVEKLLEDAGVKLSVVASDIFGVSGRDMLDALLAGQRDPTVLADLARGSMRRKTSRLREAFVGRFDDHHAYLLAKMVRHIDQIDAEIADLDTRIEAVIAPFGEMTSAVQRLDEIPGIAALAATVIIAEIGTDMSRFPTPGHLCAWAGFAPVTRESAGRSKSRSTGHGNKYLARILGDAVAGAARTDTFLGARYGRLVRRRGKKKAIVAVARSMLMIIWHLLHDPEARYTELGADWYDTRKPVASRVNNHVRQLQALGYTVTLTPAA